MLPDFPQLKTDLHQRLLFILRSEIAARGGIVSQIGVVSKHEGDKWTFDTVDGDVKEIQPKTIAATVEVPIIPKPSFGLEDMVEKIKEMAQSMAEQQTKMLFSSVSEAVEEVGNVVDAKGQRLSAELILQMLETVQIDFDERGNPRLPTLVLNPVQTERLKEQLQRIETEPELRKKRQEIINRQREDWYDRESNRKLVD
jgi:hypothetical protein